MLAIGIHRRVGILHYRCQGRVGHSKPAVATSQKPVSQKTKRIGITVEIDNIAPLSSSTAEHTLQLLSIAISEIRRNSLLPRVTERRVAQVMSQTCSRYNIPNLRDKRIIQHRLLLNQTACHTITQ